MEAFEIAIENYPTATGTNRCDIATIRAGMIGHHEKVRVEEQARPRRATELPPNPEYFREQLNALGTTDNFLGYWRCSSQKQSGEYGPDLQRKQVAAYAAATCDRGVDIWCHDLNAGSDDSRIGVELLTEAMKSGKIKTIGVFRYDRLARSQHLSESLHKLASEHGVEIISVTESIPKQPSALTS